MRIVVSGWNVGFQKVGFTELLRSEFGLPLARAKAATDSVLSNKPVSLPLPPVQSKVLPAKLEVLGAKYSAES